MIRLLPLAAFILATGRAMAAPPAAAPLAAAPPNRPDTQAIVGPTGSMYNGNNTLLHLPDDGSTVYVTAIAAGTAANGPLPAQDADRSSVSRIGGGN